MESSRRKLHEQTNAQHLAALARHGDVPQARRRVDHTLLFRRMSAAKAAVTELQGSGFVVEHPQRRGLRVTVEAWREDSASLESVARFTDELLGVADRHGGVYDGWGTFVADDDGASRDV